MLEFLRHALGLCGEPHPSLLNFLIATPVLGYVILRIKEIFKKEIMTKFKNVILKTLFMSYRMDSLGYGFYLKKNRR